MRVRSTVIACLAALATGGAAQPRIQTRPPAAPAGLKRAVGCLVAADYVREYSLAPLGLHIGEWVWARYYVGSVKGMNPTPEEYYIAIYAPDSQRGELLEAFPNDRGGFEAARNGYRLWKTGQRWAADEGEGGYMDYEAFGRLATRLARQPEYRVHLVPGGSECAAESE